MLYLLFGFLLLCQASNGAFFPQEIEIPLILGLGIGALAVSRLWKQPVTTEPLKWVLLIMLWLCISTITSPVITTSLIATKRYLLYGVIFIAGLTLQTKEKRGILLLFLSLAVGNSFIACLQEAFHSTHILGLKGWQAACVPGRYNGLFYNPNYLGGLAVAAEGVLITWFLIKKTPTCKWKLGTLLISLALLSEAIIASKSREACLWSLGALVLAGIIGFSRHLPKAALLAGFLLILQGLSFFAHRDLVKHTEDLGQTTLTIKSPTQPGTGENTRITIWQGSVALWEKSPLTGIHPQMLDTRWPEVDQSNIYPFMSHNLVLQILCDLGLIGAFLFLAFGISWCKNVKLNLSSMDSTTLLSGVGGLLLVSHDLLDYSMYSIFFGGLAVLLLASGLTTRTAVLRVKLYTVTGTTSILLLVAALLMTENIANYYLGKPGKSFKERSHYVALACKWNPYTAAFQTETAVVAAKTGDTSGLGHALLKAYQLDPYDPEITFRLACFLSDHNKKAISESLITQMLEKSPNNKQILNRCIQYYTYTGDTNQSASLQQRLNNQHTTTGFSF